VNAAAPVWEHYCQTTYLQTGRQAFSSWGVHFDTPLLQIESAVHRTLPCRWAFPRRGSGHSMKLAPNYNLMLNFMWSFAFVPLCATVAWYLRNSDYFFLILRDGREHRGIGAPGLWGHQLIMGIDTFNMSWKMSLSVSLIYNRSCQWKALLSLRKSLKHYSCAFCVIVIKMIVTEGTVRIFCVLFDLVYKCSTISVYT
jgi:hypothetical protein